MGCECQGPEETLGTDIVTDESSKKQSIDKNNENLYLFDSNNDHLKYPAQKYLSKQKKPKEQINEQFYAYNITKNDKNNEEESIDFSNALPNDDFSKYIFEHINKLRQNPHSFIDIIKKQKSNVTIDKSGIKIYKSCVKVAINTGEEAFDLAVKILENTQPMKKLIYNPDITVKIPNNEEDIKSKLYLSDKVTDMINNGINVKSFWKDIISDPETCFILMVVDDSGKCAGHKRNDILDPDSKFIGISSVKIGKSFACYITLSNNEKLLTDEI